MSFGVHDRTDDEFFGWSFVVGVLLTLSIQWQDHPKTEVVCIPLPALSQHALPTNLAQLCAASRWQGLHLLREESLLVGEALRGQHALLGQLLAEIGHLPSFVVEAMKEPYAPTGVLHAEGFQPLPFERVYPDDAVVDGEWIYLYNEAKVRAMLASAPCGREACAAGDDDGESLESVFGLLKSQFALLGRAIDQGKAVAFAEMST